MKGLRALPRLALWRWLGRLGLLLIVVVCLVPMPPAPSSIVGSDKLHHALSWLLITLWYAQLTATPRALLARACGFAALGAAIELVQALTAWRSGDGWDLLANLAGVVVGVVIGLTPLRGVLARFDRAR